MSELKTEYHDKEVLQKVAEVEADSRPFNYETAGVEYTDIINQFSYEDFGNPPMIMIPNRMKWLSESGYLKQVYPGGSSANASYRLTARGWNTVNVTEPTESVENLDN